MLKKDIFYTIANVFVGVLLLVLGILQIISGIGSFKLFVLGIYGILFGVTILMAEFKLRFLVVEYCGFLNNLLGRGLYYVFVGVLMLEMQPVYILVLSIVVLAIGFAYILLWFIPAARPSKVTATQG